MKIKELINKDVAVHCNTEKKSATFLWHCDTMGVRWYNGKCLLFNSYYSDYKNETCYSIKENELGYSGRYQYINAGYKIVEFEELELG